MPRPIRIQRENTTYHIWSRCIEWRSLLKTDTFKEMIKETLQKTQEFYSFELVAYQIMDSHIHLIIRTMPNQAPISTIIQYLKARVAERYNKRVGRIGPFWNERYRDSIIEDSERPDIYLIWLLWYLAFNPVRKGYVSDPRQYNYGSIRAYLEEDYQDIVEITRHTYFIQMGKSFQERLRKFQYFEEAYKRKFAVI